MQIIYGKKLLDPRQYIVEDCPYSAIHECLIDISANPQPISEGLQFYYYYLFKLQMGFYPVAVVLQQDTTHK
jgi:hypothetical protein